ncbi:copper amine oxidase [Paenibacillus barcinonensis]|uniref:Alpha-tubulin suppressor-like RCC1 family protein n=1 Tax=Paenibacillus barcinonensis TaxID=198119 RepID=A0A2V4VAT5_PAEBA|nr:copper amine oxidase [Paenibacillus barcinonensis]PYE49297.1 alpha-tubulin suppressor-like RCC1 family protein [Paenibacillus barcinonensis]QKS55515.1 copper amine oxidase [Paenibacillus barcinonensis]
MLRKRFLLSVLSLVTIVGLSSGIANAAPNSSYDNLLTAANYNTYLVMKDGSSFYAVGQGGRLGVSAGNYSAIPLKVDISDISMIDGGMGTHSVLVKNDGTLWSWGYIAYGEGGTGKRQENLKVPTKSPLIDNVKEARAADGFTIVLKNDGTVWSYGRNSYGQLGIGTKGEPIGVPTKIQGLSRIVAIDSNERTSAALDEDNVLWVWGQGATGSLGQNSDEDQPSPVPYPIEDVKSFSVGPERLYVITHSGEVYGSGRNTQGQLGDGTKIKRSYPVSIDITNVEQISVGSNATLALKKDGSVWAWGVNNSGQVGNGTTNFSYNTPVQVLDNSYSPLTDVVAIVARSNHSHALKTDGSLWSWGSNDNGKLGIDKKIQKQIVATKSDFPNAFD